MKIIRKRRGKKILSKSNSLTKQQNKTKNQLSEKMESSHQNNMHPLTITSKQATQKKVTIKNVCKKRKNPYRIYSQKKKDDFYKVLNQEYDNDLQIAKETKKYTVQQKNKKVIFENSIQVRQYAMEEQVVQFLANAPKVENVNQEENKLDC